MGCGVSFPVSLSPGRIPATTYGTLERRARSRAFSASVSSRVTLMLAAGRRSACSRAVRTIDRTADRTVDRGPVRALTEPSALAERRRSDIEYLSTPCPGTATGCCTVMCTEVEPNDS